MNNLAELNDLFGSMPSPVIEPVTVELPDPGVYHGVPAAEYHKWPAISSTLLKAYATLPSTARTPYKPSDDARVGSGIHAYSLLGPDLWQEECFIGPDFGKGKKDLEAKAELDAEHPTKTVLPAFYGSPSPGVAMMDILTGVDASLKNHPKVGQIMAESCKEVSLVWIDDVTGCHCKARLDIWHDQVIWDLKKVRAISGFRYQLAQLNYHIQAGFYFEGAVACGLNPVAFGFIPVEAFPPYQVGCGYVELEKLDKARAEAQRLLGLVKQSILYDNWPNYPIPSHIYDLDDIQPDDLVDVY